MSVLISVHCLLYINNFTVLSYVNKHTEFSKEKQIGDVYYNYENLTVLKCLSWNEDKGKRD